MSFTLRQARKYADLTEQEAADTIGVSKSTYRRYERQSGGMPSEMLVRFSKATQIPIDQFTIGRQAEEGVLDVQSAPTQEDQ